MEGWWVVVQVQHVDTCTDNGDTVVGGVDVGPSATTTATVPPEDQQCLQQEFAIYHSAGFPVNTARRPQVAGGTVHPEHLLLGPAVGVVVVLVVDIDQAPAFFAVVIMMVVVIATTTSSRYTTDPCAQWAFL